MGLLAGAPAESAREPMRLLIVRHGATPNNLETRFTGQLDVPLSPLGERQAALVGDALAGEEIAAIVSSDLRRARATAEAIARHHRLAVRDDPDLREIGMGVWEGRTLAEVEAQDAALLKRWTEDPLAYAPAGGETVAGARERIVRALGRWAALFPDGRTVLWVTHGGVIGVLLCHLLGMDLKRRGQFRRDNAAINEIAIGEGFPLIIRLNDTAHLRAGAGEPDAERFQVL